MAEPYHNEEVLAVLKQRIEADGDTFRIRVFRKKFQGAFPEAIAVFDEVQINHLASPEVWLPRLVGGGQFTIRVYHSTDTAKPIGKDLLFQITGAERELDPNMVNNPNYNGPRKLAWPTPPEQPPGTNIHQFPAPMVPQVIAPQTSVPGGVPSGSGVQNVQPTAYDPHAAALMSKERELYQMQHKLELERLEMRNEMRMKELSMQVELRQSQAATAAAAQPKSGGGTELIQVLVTALTPVLTAIIQGQQAAQAAQTAMLQQIAQRPSMDPTMEKIITHHVLERRDDAPNAKIMSSMAESMSAVMDLQREAVKGALDMAGRGDEPNSIKIVRELVKAVGAASQAITMTKPGAAPVVRPRPKALPGGKQQPPRRVAAAPVPVPPVAPGPLPVAAEPTPVPVVVFEDTPTEPAVPPDEPGEWDEGEPTIVDRIEEMIRAKIDPKSVAATFIDAMNDPDMQDELQGANRDPVAMFKNRLGAWLLESPDNVSYIQQELLPVLHERMKEEFGGESEDGEEDEGEEDAA
jgi:hypothetical protein